MRGDEPGVRGMLHGAHDGVSQVWKADEVVRDGEGEGCGRCEGLLYLESVVGEQGRESCYSGNLERFHMFGFRVLVFFFFFPVAFVVAFGTEETRAQKSLVVYG